MTEERGWPHHIRAAFRDRAGVRWTAVHAVVTGRSAAIVKMAGVVRSLWQRFIFLTALSVQRSMRRHQSKNVKSVRRFLFFVSPLTSCKGSRVGSECGAEARKTALNSALM